MSTVNDMINSLCIKEYIKCCEDIYQQYTAQNMSTIIVLLFNILKFTLLLTSFNKTPPHLRTPS